MGSNARTGSTPVPSTKEKLYGFSFFVCSVREVCKADYAMMIYSSYKQACVLYIIFAGYALLSHFALRIAVLTYCRLREQDYVYCSTKVCAYMRSRYCFAVRPRFRVPERNLCGFSFFVLYSVVDWYIYCTPTRKIALL